MIYPEYNFSQQQQFLKLSVLSVCQEAFDVWISLKNMDKIIIVDAIVHDGEYPYYEA